MIKKIGCFLIICFLFFSLVACDNEMSKITKQFDLSDPKEFWTGTIDDNFTDDRVLVVMRKTSTFPELELHHFKLDNAESVKYIALRPPESYVADGGNPSQFYQIAVIYLKEHGKEKVIDAIKHLEKLPFIKNASPNGVFPGPQPIVGKAIDFTIGHINNGTSSGENDMQRIVNTFSQWTGIRDEREDFSELDEKYIEEFFADSSLIVFTFTKGSNINQIEIDRLSKNENELLLTVKVVLGEMEVMSKGIIILEVNKSDIAEVSELRIVEN